MFADWLRDLMSAFLLAAGLLAPGWLLGRALGVVVGLTGSFLGSLALLLHLVLVLDATGIPLRAATFSLGLAMGCTVLALLAWRRSRAASSRAAAAAPPAPVAAGAAPATRRIPPWSAVARWSTHDWLWLPAGLGLIAIGVPAILNPLAGFDTLFRWDFLARQMVQEGSLGFYPPVTPADFRQYGWCDGIAPLISSVYAWIYLIGGSSSARDTAPAVILQGVVLFWSVADLARRHGGRRAAPAAAAILATSPVLLWGIAMGQETGITAIALVAMFLYIERHGAGVPGPWLIWAGLAAGVGALAREYGLAFAAFGAFALAWRRIPRRGWVEFGAAFALVALPWYLRNGLRTGNPLYPHELGGLLPGNPIQSAYFAVVAQLRGIGTDATRPLDLVLLVGRLAGVPLALGLAGYALRRRASVPLLVAIAGLGAIWLWSISQTSGGPVYSLRVLTPALALAAVGGGSLLARWTSRPVAVLSFVLLTGLVVDAGARSLFLPVDPRVAWWHVRADAWLDRSKAAAWWNHQPHWAALTAAAGPAQILVVDPFAHALLARQGARPVPFYSPAVRFLFARDADFRTCLQRLRTEEIRFAVLPQGNPINDALLAPYPFFRSLLKLPPTAEPPLLAVYDLRALPEPPHAP